MAIVKAVGDSCGVTATFEYQGPAITVRILAKLAPAKSGQGGGYPDKSVTVYDSTWELPQTLTWGTFPIPLSGITYPVLDYQSDSDNKADGYVDIRLPGANQPSILNLWTEEVYGLAAAPPPDVPASQFRNLSATFS